MKAHRNEPAVKTIDLAGRQRQIEPAMAALKAVASQFCRGARRSLPFIARYRGRVVPGGVTSLSTASITPPFSGPRCRARLESEDGVFWAIVEADTDAINLIVEGCLGGGQFQEEEHDGRGVGSELTLAQRAVLTRVLRSLSDDLAAAVSAELGVGLKTSAVQVYREGDSPALEANALSIPCAIEGLTHPGTLGVLVGAEALDASLRGGAVPDGTDHADPRLAEALEGVTLDAVAELGRMKLGLRRVLTLKPGDVIRLPTAVDDPVSVSIGGIPKLVGVPVVSRGQLAIQIRGRHEE